MIVSQNIIYHITTKSEWELAVSRGFYMASSLVIEGFIHCATAAQVEGVLQRYFNGKPDLLKLVIDPLLLTSPYRFDMSVTVNEAFPHIYGHINLDAVLDVLYL